MSLQTWNELSVEDKIKRCKVRLYKRSPFFSYILLYMGMKKDNENIPSMGVDYKGNLYYNEEWVSKRTEDELMSVLIHEASHIALMHLTRLKGRNTYWFNVANDMVVNNMLVKDGYTLPGDGIVPSNNEFTIDVPQLGYKKTIKDIDKKSSEEIYDEMNAPVIEIEIEGGFPKPDGDQNGKGSGPVKVKVKNPPPGVDKKKLEEELQKLMNDHHGYGSEKDKHKNEKKWKERVSEAAAHAKQRGQLPAGMERLIDNILESKIDWLTELYKYLIQSVVTDYTWNRPSRRSSVIGTYMPKTVREGMKVVVTIDTSGSMDRQDLERGISETLAVAETFGSVDIEVIIIDAEVHETYSLTKENARDLVGMAMSGGGGTDHVPAFDYIEENINDCKVMINFTDGYTRFPDNAPGYDVLWVLGKNSTSPDNVPFGKVIKVAD